MRSISPFRTVGEGRKKKKRSCGVFGDFGIHVSQPIGVGPMIVPFLGVIFFSLTHIVVFLLKMLA